MKIKHSLGKIGNLTSNLLNARQIYVLLFIFLVSFVPRVAYISEGLPHHDSVQTAIATEKTLDTGKLHGITENRYGYILINAIAYSITHFVFGINSSETTINIVTVLFAALSAVAVYLFAKELLNNKYIAFSSSLLFSFNPIYLSITTYAKSHAHSIFFIILAAYFLLKSIKTDSTVYKVFFSISLGFSLFIRFSDVIASLPFFLLLILLAKKILGRGSIKINFSSRKNLFIMAMPFFLMATAFWITTWKSLSGSLSGNKFLNPDFILISNIFVAIFLFIPLIAVLLLIFGLLQMVKKDKYTALLLIAWFIGIFVFYSSFITAKLRFFVMLLIPLSIFIGTALDYFRKKFNPSYLPILIIVLVLMFMYAYPFLSYRHEASSEKESAIFISATTEGNAIIFDAGDSGVFYDYYTDRKIVSCLYANKEKEFDEKIMLINNALKRSIPVYMSSQCFSLAKGEDTKFDVLWSTLRQDYQFAEVGKVYKENPESVVIADPKEYIIYKLRIKS